MEEMGDGRKGGGNGGYGFGKLGDWEIGIGYFYNKISSFLRVDVMFFIHFILFFSPDWINCSAFQ